MISRSSTGSSAFGTRSVMVSSLYVSLLGVRHEDTARPGHVTTGLRSALGSRRTQARRAEALTEAGLTEEQLRRIYGPIGLDIVAVPPRRRPWPSAPRFSPH
ncbi:XdhC family protein [Streptomyces mirabilis]|uniref:XdhC family protein n=1 Tax=Streptomyces mirabilis TaxID=68239 RepID=UPI003641280E